MIGAGLQDANLSLDELYEQGRLAQPEFDLFGKRFLQHLREKYPNQFGGVQFEQAPLKSIIRVSEKIAGDYDGDHTRVADIVRGRFLVETPEQIQILREEMRTSRESLGIKKLKDFYAEPLGTHFRTLNSQVQMPNGHVVEFRIDQYDMAADPFMSGVGIAQARHATRHRQKQPRALMTPDEVLHMPEDEQILFISGLGLAPLKARKRPYFTRPEMAGGYLPNPFHPPLDRVPITGRKWGLRASTWARVVRENVPADLAHWPQHQSGQWAYTEGYRPAVVTRP